MEENKNTNHFWKGALCGALAMFAVVSIIWGAGKASGALVKSKMNTATEENTTSGIEIDEDTTSAKLKYLQQLVDEYYLYSDDVDGSALQEGIYAGYINALGDPYSVYYDEEETKALFESTSGEYSGIGVVFSQNANTKISTAVQVYPGSPAEEAGVKAGDILYKVDGEDVTSEDLSEVVAKIRGEEGTQVTLTVLRGDSQQEVVLDITRGVVQVQTVTYTMKDNQIGYIRITEFDKVTYEQFENALNDLNEQGMKGLVVDLRANPGGNLDTVSNILDLLLPEGTVVYTEDKNGKRQEWTSDEEHQFTKPLAVLVDSNSASASEIFAGAIQDYGIGTLVGTTTFGKGIVQQLIQLPDDTCVKLTISEYFTPKGRNIHKKGIDPDVEVEYVSDEANPDADNQLDVALKEVMKKLNQ